MMSINAVKGFEYGGVNFAMSKQRGSQVNDSFIDTPDGLKTKTNNSGRVFKEVFLMVRPFILE